MFESNMFNAKQWQAFGVLCKRMTLNLTTDKIH